MDYEFEGCDNPDCPDHEKGVVNRYVIPYPMGKAPRCGEQIPCPRCPTGKITRVFSTVNVTVRAGNPEMQNGHSYMTRIGDQDTKLTFMDHPHTDPGYQANMTKLGQQVGLRSMSAPEYSEKHGKRVVTVESNVPDPLGMLKSQRQKYGTDSHKVNAPVKIRQGGKGKAAINKKKSATPSYIPVRRS